MQHMYLPYLKNGIFCAPADVSVGTVLTNYKEKCKMVPSGCRSYPNVRAGDLRCLIFEIFLEDYSNDYLRIYL